MKKIFYMIITIVLMTNHMSLQAHGELKSDKEVIKEERLAQKRSIVVSKKINIYHIQTIYNGAQKNVDKFQNMYDNNPTQSNELNLLDAETKFAQAEIALNEAVEKFAQILGEDVTNIYDFRTLGMDWEEIANMYGVHHAILGPKKRIKVKKKQKKENKSSFERETYKKSYNKRETDFIRKSKKHGINRSKDNSMRSGKNSNHKKK